MQINPLVQPEAKPIKNDNDAVATEKKDKTSSTVASNENTERFSSENHRLLIGAKSLMSALNQELKLEGSFEFKASYNDGFSISTESGSILDKIDVEPISFDFEEVARNVMDFLTSHIEGAKKGGASDEKLEELLAQARAGVEMGFEQARDELEGMNMLSDDVQEGMDRSYDAIGKGINDLESSLFETEKNEADLVTDSVINREIGLQETEQGSISIKTRDGDDVNISFGSQTTLGQSQSFEGNQSSSQTSFNTTQSFSIKVEGDLNDEELEAINGLVTDISKLADEFFNGDVQKAFEQASDLGFDASQIAQFSLDFTEVKQVAVREHYAPNQSSSPIATISPYMQDLNDVMNNGNSLFSQDNLDKLMQGVAQEHLNMMDDLLSKSAIDFSNFNQQLIDAQEKAA